MYAMLCIRINIVILLVWWVAINLILDWNIEWNSSISLSISGEQEINMLVYCSPDLVQVGYTYLELHDDNYLEVYIWIIICTWLWVIAWRSIEQSCIIDSTMEVEYVSAFQDSKKQCGSRNSK